MKFFTFALVSIVTTTVVDADMCSEENEAIVYKRRENVKEDPIDGWMMSDSDCEEAGGVKRMSNIKYCKNEYKYMEQSGVVTCIGKSCVGGYSLQDGVSTGCVYEYNLYNPDAIDAIDGSKCGQESSAIGTKNTENIQKDPTNGWKMSESDCKEAGGVLKKSTVTDCKDEFKYMERSGYATCIGKSCGTEAYEWTDDYWTGCTYKYGSSTDPIDPNRAISIGIGASLVMTSAIVSLVVMS